MKKSFGVISLTALSATLLAGCHGADPVSLISMGVKDVRENLVTDGKVVESKDGDYALTYVNKTMEPTEDIKAAEYTDVAEADAAAALAGGEGWYSIEYKAFDGLKVETYGLRTVTDAYGHKSTVKVVTGGLFYDVKPYVETDAEVKKAEDTVQIDKDGTTKYEVTKYEFTGDYEVFKSAAGEVGYITIDTDEDTLEDITVAEGEAAVEFLADQDAYLEGLYAEVADLKAVEEGEDPITVLNTTGDKKDTVFIDHVFYTDGDGVKFTALSKSEAVKGVTDLDVFFKSHTPLFATTVKTYTEDVTPDVVTTKWEALNTDGGTWIDDDGEALKKSLEDYEAYTGEYDVKKAFYLNSDDSDFAGFLKDTFKDALTDRIKFEDFYKDVTGEKYTPVEPEPPVEDETPDTGDEETPVDPGTGDGEEDIVE